MSLPTIRTAPAPSGTVPPPAGRAERDLLSDLLLRTYDVAIGGAGWPQLAAQLAEHLGGRALVMFVVGSRSDSFELLATAGEPSSAFVRLCVDAAHDRSIAKTSLATVAASNRVAGARWGTTLDDMAGCVAGEPLGAAGDEYICVGCAAGLYGAVDAEAMAAQVDVVLPYLSRAVAIERRLRMAAAQSRANAAILDRVPFGLFQLDHKGLVVSANVQATHIAQMRRGLTATASGVHAMTDGDEARLQRAIAEVLSSGGAACSRRVSVKRGSNARPYSVLVSSIAPDCVGLSARTACVLFVTDPEAQPMPTAEAIAGAFGLTPAEARVASGLAMGVSLPETAAKLGISINTARTLLSRAMARTGTNSQLGLVRLVLTGLTLVHADE